MGNDLSNVVAVVTGSTRGIGRGMAEALGAHGATVYVTGRTAKPGQSPWAGHVGEAAQAVSAAGGQGVPVVCDFGDDAQVKALFARVEKEQGKLHVLVNNAADLNAEISAPGPFWEKSLDILRLFNVGLRSSYVASYYAAPLLLRGQRGLICNTSTYESLGAMLGPAYGVQKAGQDKLAADMAADFKAHNIACVSYWFGAVATERHKAATADTPEGYAGGLFRITESPEFSGHVLAAMYRDPQLMAYTGRTFIVAELAKDYGIKDRNGVEPPSYRAQLGAPPAPYAGTLT